MALFMDVHENMKGVTKEQLDEAHKKDLEVASKHGVKYHDYWYNAEEGKVFCLSEAPDKETAEAVHKEAHGGAADRIFEVKRGD